MAFSTVFFIFCALPICVAVYAVVPVLFGRFKPTAAKIVLLAASIVFFSWSTQQYLVLMICVAFGNYLLALAIARTHGGIKKAILALSVICDALMLLYYKYFNWFIDELAPYVQVPFENTAIIQPLGISFLTFSLISYLVEVYQGKCEADTNPLNVVLWAMFFPKMMQGPIARYNEMFGPDKHFTGGITRDNLFYGTRRFVIGLGKKVLIADVLGVVVDTVFKMHFETGCDTPTAWLGIICYTFQIFFDFAGYSDMAIGLSAIFGFRINENFNYPYISKTVGEFWRRWHISLSGWLRDFVYFPLGGSRRGNVYVNLCIVFLVSGFWHGADWHYVIWGAWYGVFMVLDRIYRQVKAKKGWEVPAPVLWFFTMCVVVFGWVIFRAQNMTQAIDYIQLLFGYGQVFTQTYGVMYYFDNRIKFLMIACCVLSTPVFRTLSEKFEGRAWFETLRMVAIPALFLLCIAFILNSNYSPFLYAQY